MPGSRVDSSREIQAKFKLRVELYMQLIWRIQIVVKKFSQTQKPSTETQSISVQLSFANRPFKN